MNIDVVRNWCISPHEIELSAQRAILYALSIGVARDPLCVDELAFVYEKDLKVLPTFALALALKGFWAQDPATGLDWKRMVLAEQGATFVNPLPVDGRIVSTSRIVDVIDKGENVGALIALESELRDAQNNRLFVTLNRTILARGDGGFSGIASPGPPIPQTPDGAPHMVCDLPTLPGQALLYRLNGDLNPLHIDPSVAAGAGYERPILHGLATLAVAGHALLKTVCNYDPHRVRSLRARFSAPVYPGETIRTELWTQGDAIVFQARVLERDVIVLKAGFCEVGPVAQARRASIG